METGKKNNTDEQAGTENQTGIKELEGTEDHASTKVQAGTEDQAVIEDIINDNTVEVRKSRMGRQRDQESTKSEITLINGPICSDGRRVVQKANLTSVAVQALIVQLFGWFNSC